MKAHELNLDSEVLDEFRENFNAALTMIIRQLKMKKLPGGTLTAKIEISMQEATTQDGLVVQMIEIEPDVRMKLGAKGRIECGKKGGLFMQLDPDGKPIVGSCQMDIDELLAEQEAEGA